MARIEGVPGDRVLPFAGSSDPLHRAVLAFTGPARSFIVADPGYEAGQRAAEYVGAKVIKVPLKKDWSHDVHAMAQADPEAGVIYVCNPNNPTGSVTTKEDIDYLVANKPKNAIILIDEAYIHFSTTAEPATPHVLAGNDVIILRTFSKLYGMAGLRAGAAIARPELLYKVSTGATSFLPTTGMVGATASLNAKGLIEERRKLTADARNETVAWLTSKGFTVIPSEANMIFVDVKQPGHKFGQAMRGQKVAVGRVWPSLPNHVRVTIGTSQEMAKFREAFARVMNV
jgi:histidinol-phosphate/aromatic aminotransferase/cobyric acid decarboxylase-like protein